MFIYDEETKFFLSTKGFNDEQKEKIRKDIPDNDDILQSFFNAVRILSNTQNFALYVKEMK